MKFLVLALCVCAASAAYPTPYTPYRQYKPVAQAAIVPVVAAQAVVDTVVPAAAVVSSPVVQTAAIVAKNVPYTKDSEAAVLRSDSEVSADGYNYVYETANGIAAQASGTVKRVGDVNVLASQGSYRYVSPDGSPVEFTYIADENGYQPQSNILPVGPPVPEAIVRALEYIRTHPAPEDKLY